MLVSTKDTLSLDRVSLSQLKAHYINILVNINLSLFGKLFYLAFSGTLPRGGLSCTAEKRCLFNKFFKMKFCVKRSTFVPTCFIF